MALGFALVHPQRLEAALDDNFTNKVAWDDGADLTFAAAGLDLGDNPLAGFLEQLQVEALDLLAPLQGLFLPGGPFAFVADTLTGAGDGLAAWIARIGNFLAELDPLHLKASLLGHVDALFGHFGGLSLDTLDDRVRRLAQRALDMLRGPLLGGRDDGAAHRAYRSAALLLARLEPLLAQAEAGLSSLDLAARIKAALSAAIDALPSSLLAGFAQVGRILRDDIGGLVAAASFSVSVSGPSPLVSGDPTYKNDADPQPFAKGHWLWWIDLLSSFVALFWSVWGFQRARGLQRPTEWIEFLLSVIWRVFRDTIRLFVQPSWLSENSSSFVRMLFSEWGDFFMRIVFMLFGCIEDMVAWSNFVMSFGNRFLKWFALELQPRIVYQFCRSVWYLRGWHDDANNNARGNPRFSRVVWAGWAPMLLVVMLIGLLLSGESYDLQSFGAAGYEGTTAGLVLTIVFQVLGTLFMPWILMGEHPFRAYAFDSLDSISLGVAVVIVLFIGVETLGSTNVGAGAAWGLRIGLVLVFGLVILGLVTIGQAVQGPSTSGQSMRWFEYIAAGQAWLVSIAGSAGIGLITMIVWWFVHRDGEDQNNDFAPLDASTSPYRLPYPRDDMWFCGQGFHGVFSHTWRSAYNPPYNTSTSSYASDNLFGHDFNNAFGKPACVARAGFVQRVSVGNTDGGTSQNQVQVQHWDWVPGHDPGSDQERELNLALYLHLAQNRARCAVGQLLLQGYNLAGIDDTGISALNHLHFHVYTTLARVRPPSPGAAPATTSYTVTQPVVFGDADVRGFRSFGHVAGKPKSLAYYVSENVGKADDAITTTPLSQPLSLTTVSLIPGDHQHNLVINAALLGTSGLPASLTLMTSEAAGHSHSVTLSAADLQTLLARGAGPLTAAATGPVGVLTGLSAAPSATSHQHTLLIQDLNANTQSFTLTTPPGGRLIADAFAPIDLVGAHVAVDVDGEAANHWLFGAQRPVIAGSIALDRGPTGSASAQIGSSSVMPSPSVGTQLSSARLAAPLWTNAWSGSVVVRPVPVIVLETSVRGTDAQLQLAGAGLGVWNVSGNPASTGTGAVASAAAVTAATLVPLVAAALAAGPGALPLSAALVGSRLRILVSGVAVASFAGSTSRIASVLPAAYNPATGRLFSDGALPLAGGRLVLDGHVVPILSAPARLRLDRATARLDPSTLLSEPLSLTVLSAVHRVVFRASDVGPDAATTLDRAASRIAAEVDGVRAFRDSDSVVVESVCAGAAASLSASKGSFSSAQTNGAAPTIAGANLQDACSITSTDLRLLIEDARDRAARAAAPVDQVTAEGNVVVVKFTPGISTPVLGEVFGWQAEVVPAPDAGSQAQLRLTPPTQLLDAIWADVSVDSDSWRIAIDADAARIDLPPLARAAAASDSINVTTSAGMSAVSLPAGASLIDQLRAFAALPGITARIAWRWSVEGPSFQAGDLTLSDGAFSALPGMGILGPAPATQLATGPASEVLQAGITTPGARDQSFPGIVGGSPDDDQPAFTAAAASGQVTLTAHSDLTLSIQLDAPGLSVDPTGLAGVGATITSVPITAGLWGHQALRWNVQLLRDSQLMAQTYVQLAAAPAKARASKLAGAAWTDSASANQQLEVVEERGLLTITVTIPGTPDVDVSMPVDLTNATTLDEVMARIAREAALVDAFLVNGVLQVQTRGAGSGWGLRMQGASTLASLGYDPAVFGSDGKVAASGGGQLRDLANPTADELRDAFTAGASAAAWTRARHFTVNLVGSSLQLRSLGAPITLSAEPQRLLDALAPAPVPGGVDIAVATTLELEQGFIRVLQGDSLLHVATVVGSRAAVEAELPLPSDITLLLTTIAGQSLQLAIDNSPAPTWIVPAGLSDLDTLLNAMRQHFTTAHLRAAARSDGAHLRISSRRRGNSSHVVVQAGPVATALGFSAQLDSQGGGQDPGLGSVADLAAVSASELQTILQETSVEGPQGVLSAVATTTGVALTPNVGTISWSPPSVIALPSDDPGGSTMWIAPGTPPSFSGATLSQAWSAPGPLIAQALQFRVQSTAPAAGSNQVDRTLITALWANPARLGPWPLPADLSALDGRTLRLVLDGANVDIAFTGLAALSVMARPAAVVAAIEGATSGRVRAAISGGLRIESREAGATAVLALGAAPANDARDLLGSPAPVGASGTGNVALLSAVTSEELATAVRNAYALDADPAQDAKWSVRNPDNLGARLTLSSQTTGTASCVVPAILPAALRMRRSLQRGPAHGGAVVLPALSADVQLSGNLVMVFNAGNTGPRAVTPSEVAVSFAAGSYSPRRVWLRIHEALRARGIGMAGIYPSGPNGFRIAIQTRLPGLQGSVKISTDAPPNSNDVVSNLLQGQALFGRGWPGVGTTANAAATLGLRTSNSGSGVVAGRTWRFQPSAAGGTPIAIALSAADSALTQLATRLDAALAAAGLGVARLHEQDGCVYVEFLDTAASIAVFDGAAPPPPGLTTGIFGQPALPAPRVGAMGDVWVDAGLQLRATNAPRTSRLVAFVADGTAAGRVLDPGWVRINPDNTGAPQTTPNMATGHYGILVRADAARSDGYLPAGEMLASTGTATVDGTDVPIVHQARYWFQIQSNDDGLGPIALPSGEIMIEVAVK